MERERKAQALTGRQSLVIPFLPHWPAAQRCRATFPTIMNPPIHLPSILGIGAGGHCKVVMEIIRRAGYWKIAGLLDADPSRKGESISGIEILGNDDLASALFNQGVRAAFIGIGSIGATQPRRNTFTTLRDLGFELPVLTHPTASVAFDTEIGIGTCIMPGAIINPGASIGECAIINSGAIIEHDCHIAAFSHISPGAILGGSVFVGEGSHVGIGAVIRQGIHIGKNAVIGAGAAVVKDVPDDTTVTGVPATARK
jgi:sugar O-acyltransferase (sialic acid O-acetyltransferase NeuD family)